MVPHVLHSPCGVGGGCGVTPSARGSLQGPGGYRKPGKASCSSKMVTTMRPAQSSSSSQTGREPVGQRCVGGGCSPPGQRRSSAPGSSGRTAGGQQVQFAATVHGHAEQRGLVAPQQLPPGPALGDKGHVRHHDAVGLLHVVQSLGDTRGEGLLEGQRGCPTALPQLTCREKAMWMATEPVTVPSPRKVPESLRGEGSERGLPWPPARTHRPRGT